MTGKWIVIWTIDRDRSSRLRSSTIPQADATRTIGIDLDDPSEVWELLSIDAVISLEDIQGQHHRVAILIVEHEARAYRSMKQRQTSSWKDVRVFLGMHCHWVFCVNAKHLPDDGEWIDLLRLVAIHPDFLTWRSKGRRCA